MQRPPTCQRGGATERPWQVGRALQAREGSSVERRRLGGLPGSRSQDLLGCRILSLQAVGRGGAGGAQTTRLFPHLLVQKRKFRLDDTHHHQSSYI